MYDSEGELVRYANYLEFKHAEEHHQMVQPK